MPSYKLTYFNLTGLGEPIRLMFTYMGQSFEDNRIEREDWPTLKPKTVFGKLPMLEVDGKEVCQSASICRYLAKQCGLAGSDDWESFMIDMIVDVFSDFRLELSKIFQEQDEAAKQKKIEVLKNETAPFYLSKMEDIVQKNNGYLVNGKLSWADIYVASLLQTFNNFLQMDVTAKHPGLHALVDKVMSHPKIKSYVDSRPKTSL